LKTGWNPAVKKIKNSSNILNLSQRKEVFKVSRMYYHELRKQIEDYVRERGLEEAMIDLHSMIGSLLWELREERNEPKEESGVDHKTSTTP